MTQFGVDVDRATRRRILDTRVSRCPSVAVDFLTLGGGSSHFSASGHLILKLARHLPIWITRARGPREIAVSFLQEVQRHASFPGQAIQRELSTSRAARSASGLSPAAPAPEALLEGRAPDPGVRLGPFRAARSTAPPERRRVTADDRRPCRSVYRGERRSSLAGPARLARAWTSGRTRSVERHAISVSAMWTARGAEGQAAPGSADSGGGDVLRSDRVRPRECPVWLKFTARCIDPFARPAVARCARLRPAAKPFPAETRAGMR